MYDLKNIDTEPRNVSYYRYQIFRFDNTTKICSKNILAEANFQLLHFTQIQLKKGCPIIW